MRPFVTSFFFLLGLVMLLIGVMLNLQAKTGTGVALILSGLAITFVSLYFRFRKKNEEPMEEYPEPDPEDFEEEVEEPGIEEPNKQ